MSKEEIHKGAWGKSVLGKGKWYFLSSLFTKGLGIILIPIYTAHLSPYDYGILQNLNAIAFVLPVLLSLSLDAAFGRFYHDIKQDKEKVSQLFSTLFWFIISYGIFLLLLIFLSAKFWLPELLEVPMYPYAFLSFIPALFTQLGILGQRYFEQSLRTRGVMLINSFSAIINGGLSVVLLTQYNLGVIARLEGIAIGALMTFTAYTIYFVKSGVLRFSFSKHLLKACLIYSVPLMPSVLGSWLARMTDKLVITHYIDLDSSGLYAFAGQIAMLIYFIGDAITRVISPITMSGLISDRSRTKQKMSKLSLYLWSFMLWLIIGATLFSKEAVMLLSNEEYLEAYKLIPVIAFVYVFGMQNRFPTQIISYYKKTWILTIGALIMGLSNLGLNILLVPRYGYTISAWTTIFSIVLYSIWIFVWGQKLDKLEFDIKKYVLILFVFLVVIFLSSMLSNQDTVSLKSIAIKLCIVIISAPLLLIITDNNVMKKSYKYVKDHLHS